MGDWNAAYDELKALVDSGVPVEQVEQVACERLDELIAADLAEDD